MLSTYQLGSLIDIVTNEVVTEVRREDNRTDDPAIIAQNEVMFEQVKSSVDSTLELLKEQRAANEDQSKQVSKVATQSQTESLNGRVMAPQTPDGDTEEKKKAEQAAALKEISDFLKGHKSNPLAMRTMTSAATPILNGFDELLSQPKLDKYNVMLNISPIVGLSGRTVRYLSKNVSKSDNVESMSEAWAHFDNLPAEVDTSQDAAIHMFPYHGSFFLSIGQALWKKVARDMNDDTRAEARNNWPKLFQDGWSKVGDKCLPQHDLRSVAPHLGGGTAGSPATFSLYAVDREGAMSVFTGNDLGDNGVFEPVALNDKAKEKIMPKWKSVSYYAGKLFGLDETSHSWNISIDGSDRRKISIADKTVQHAAISGLSANEEGLVAIREGSLWRRKVATAITEEDRAVEDKAWEHLIKCDDVTHIGVASPGSMLDLHTLTKALRGQYVDTQTQLMPLVTKILQFTGMHQTLVKRMKRASENYEKETDKAKRKQIKKKACDESLRMAMKWAVALNKASTNAQGTIASMTSSLQGVGIELHAIQKTMESKLVELQAVLTKKEEALKTIKNVEMWMTIVMLVSFVLIMLCMATPLAPVAIFCGFLFAGAFITAKIYESEAEDQEREIAKTVAEVSDLKTSIDQLKKIIPQFDNLNTQYQALNMFWGRMSNGSENLARNTSEELLDDFYESLFSEIALETAEDAAKELKDAAQGYLDMLNSQGIYLSEVELPNFDQESAAMVQQPDISLNVMFDAIRIDAEVPFATKVVRIDQSSLEDGVNRNDISIVSHSDTQETQHSGVPANDEPVSFNMLTKIEVLTQNAFALHVQRANDALDEGDLALSLSHMEAATVVLDVPALDEAETQLRSGRWFNIDAIKSGMSVWYSGELKELLVQAADSKGLLAPVGRLAGDILMLGAKNVSIEVVEKTIELAKLMDEWSKDTTTTISDEQRIAQAKPYVNSAIVLCNTATNVIAKLNNAFTTVNHAVSDAQLKLNAQIRETESQMAAIDDQDWGKLYNLKNKIPFWTMLEGKEAVFRWAEEQAEGIRQDHANARRPYEERVARLKKLCNSGFAYQDQHLTWMNLVQRISMMFGRVYSTLKMIQDQMEEDVVFYADTIFTIQWPSLVENATEVLLIFGVPIGSKESQISQIVTQAATMIPSAMVSSTMSLRLEKVAEEVLEQDNTQGRDLKPTLYHALRVHPVLAVNLKNGAKETDKFFDSINKILSLPNVQIIKAHDEASTPQSLQMVTHETLAKYVESYRLTHRALNTLQSMASMQNLRVKKLQAGRLRWDTFSAGTKLALIDVTRHLSVAHDGLEIKHIEFREMLKSIKQNRKAFQEKIKPIDDLIDSKKKVVDEWIFQLAADGAALLFISAAASLAVVAGPAIALKAASAVASAAGGVDGFSISRTFKTFYSSMNWDEFQNSMVSLNLARQSLTTAIAALDVIDESFRETIKFGSDLLVHLRETQQRMDDFQNLNLVLDLAAKRSDQSPVNIEKELERQDLDEIAHGWQAAGDMCDVWMDSFNAHGAAFEMEG